MQSSVITLTFGDVGENHKGMQMIGQRVERGDGFNYADLDEIKKRAEEKGCVATIYSLNTTLDEYDAENDADDAYVLVIRNVIQTVFNQYDELCREQLSLNYDKKAFMYGRVVNKHARYNLCFDDTSQEPSYEEGKGRIVAYTDMPVLNKMKQYFNQLFGPKFQDMKCESNYYYDKNTTGIGYHGDSERRKVVALRLGSSLPIHYQWYKNHMPVGLNMKLELNGGDMYVMSEKAVGTDWKESSKYTLRHATGCDKFTRVTIPKPKQQKRKNVETE